MTTAGDICYRCEHRRDEHRDGDCAGIWQGEPCPCDEFDEAERWQGLSGWPRPGSAP